MRTAPVVVLALVLATGGYMIVDGIHAFAVGDYITPSSGAYEGQVGPWSSLVEALGIAPGGDLMKTIFVAWGANWCLLALLHLHRPDRWWIPLAIWSFASAWYLVIGSVFALAAGIILVTPWGRPESWY